MANRAVSLPHTSTSSPIGPHAIRLNFDSPYGVPPEFTAKERSQSESMSGLPSVHVKSHNQHRFIIRNSNHRKSKMKSDSLIEIDEPPSPDLIEVPFEDVVRRTRGGDFPHNQTGKEIREIGESCMKDGRIDCAEDCLNGHVSEDNYNNIDDGNDDSCSSSRTCTRQSSQISDALIIPDSFESEHDVSLSPSETIMV